MTIDTTFTVNGSLPTDAVAVAAGSTVTLAIVSLAGLSSIEWVIAGNDRRTRVDPAITKGGSPQGATATFVMPADIGDGLGQSYRIQCIGSDGRSPPQRVVAESIVGVANGFGVVPLANGEELARHPVYGWTEAINNALGVASGVDHRTVPQGHIHSPVNWTFTGDTQRRLPGAYLTTDLGGECMQTDTSPPTFWKLVAFAGSSPTATPTWRQITTTVDNTLSAVGLILGTEPAWWIDGVTSTIVDAGGGFASSASDASGNAFGSTFASGQRPSIIASGLNSKKTLRFTTSQYGGNTSFAAVAPGTQPIYTFMVVKSGSLVGSSIFLGTGANNIYLGGFNKVNDFNGAGGAQSTVISAATWYIVEVLRSNTGTDYVEIGGVSAGTVPANAGNTANTGYMLNATSAGGQVGDNEYATIFQWRGTPTGPNRTALRAWANSVWGV